MERVNATGEIVPLAHEARTTGRPAARDRQRAHDRGRRRARLGAAPHRREDHRGRLPHRRRAVPDRDRRRRAAPRADRSSTSAATPPSELDHVRQLLVNEPRGHADMYGCFVTEPNDAGADLGVVFFHNAGYSTACGHGTIALATAALELGCIPSREPETELEIDVPSGRLPVAVTVEDGARSGACLPQRARVRRGGGARRRGARAWTSRSAAPSTRRSAAPVGSRSSRRRPAADRARAGAKRALEAEREIVAPARAGAARHLRRHLLAARRERRAVQRNVTVFADGEVDRSPCGSGTSARLALLDSRGRARARRDAPPPEHRGQRVRGPRGRRRRGGRPPGGRDRDRGHGPPDGVPPVRAPARRRAGHRFPASLGSQSAWADDPSASDEAPTPSRNRHGAAVPGLPEGKPSTGARAGRPCLGHVDDEVGGVSSSVGPSSEATATQTACSSPAARRPANASRSVVSSPA